MKADPTFLEMANVISPQSVREYAKANGWEQVKEGVKGRIYLFRHSSEALRQIIIPIDANITEYAEMVLDAAWRIAAIENRSIESVLNDLMLPNADVLRFRLIEPETVGGSVSLQDGINLLEGAKKALLAAACSVVSPQSHHARMSRTEAAELLSSCRLGQTERGSYIVRIVCPFGIIENPPELIGESEPFVRKATKLLLRSSRRIVEAIERDEVEKVYQNIPGEPVISWNLCDALLQMQSFRDGVTLSISATWASTKPEPSNSEAPKEVKFNPDYFPVVSDIHSKLRPSGEDKESVFVATVETLNGDLGAHGRRAGDVGLWLFHEEEILPAHVDLNADEYAVADKAHMTGSMVFLKGVLHRGKRMHKISNIEGFRLLEETSS